MGDLSLTALSAAFLDDDDGGDGGDGDDDGDGDD